MRKFYLLSVALLTLAGCQFNSSQQIEEEPLEIPALEEVMGYQVKEVVSGLEVPWDMAFTSENRILITERPGRLREVVDGVLNPTPIRVFREVSSISEEGLMSITLDPNYAENKWIYLSLAYQKGEEIKVKVVRFVDAGDHLESEKTIIEDLPAAKFHAGSRVRFGPDGKLYITVGDGLNKDEAQNLDSLAGKILRLNADGSIPSDNPFPGSRIWSYGHRNSQGIAWHPETGEMYETEHGPSIIDGPPGGDEVNHIVAGANYGWPIVSHDQSEEGMIPPIIQFTPAEPPASLMIYSGEVFPAFKNQLFFGSLKGEGLMQIQIDTDDPDLVLQAEKLPGIDVGRIRNVIQGPDGFIYFSNSNQDGRGKPSDTDDRIFRIIPKN